jgi:energy-coupling factor transporter ATP-binding protein EcfA2
VIREIEIEGFKSIDRLKLELGRVTVLIGENGCGKSNILEAIAFASAAYAVRLDYEFLASRGIRATSDPELMRPAFASRGSESMRVLLRSSELDPLELHFKETTDSTTRGWLATASMPSVMPDEDEVSQLTQDLTGKWRQKGDTDNESEGKSAALWGLLKLLGLQAMLKHDSDLKLSLMLQLYFHEYSAGLGRFLVFSPENSALRTFQREGQILPIGINGEGLFAHLQALDRAGKTDVLEELNRRLSLIDWFSGFEIPADLGPGENRLTIRDRYLSDVLLDQRSANEGFLFLLFYYTLLLSPDAPTFFAIDNIDASLNPRLCARLMTDVVKLAKQQDRQVVVTTHNPAVLDGLDLSDEDQRLVVVSRTEDGATRVRRVQAPKPIEGAPALRLSEAFLRGFLGGLPDNF